MGMPARDAREVILMTAKNIKGLTTGVADGNRLSADSALSFWTDPVLFRTSAPAAIAGGEEVEVVVATAPKVEMMPWERNVRLVFAAGGSSTELAMVFEAFRPQALEAAQASGRSLYLEAEEVEEKKEDKEEEEEEEEEKQEEQEEGPWTFKSTELDYEY